MAHPAVARHRRRRRRRAARRRRRREQRLQVVVLELAPQVVEDVAVVLGLATDDRRADPDLVLVLQRVGVVLADARPVDVRAVRRQVLEHDVDAVLAALEPDAAVHRRDDVVRERLAAARLAAHRPLALGQIVRAVLRLLLVADAGEAGPRLHGDGGVRRLETVDADFDLRAFSSSEVCVLLPSRPQRDRGRLRELDDDDFSVISVGGAARAMGCRESDFRADDDDMSMVSSASRSGRKVKRKSERRALVDKGAPKTYGKCAAAAVPRSKVRGEGFYEL